jgi:hypothetical protein
MKWELLISQEYEKWFNDLPQKHPRAETIFEKHLKNIQIKKG